MVQIIFYIWSFEIDGNSLRIQKVVLCLRRTISTGQYLSRVMRKPFFAYAKTKRQIRFAVTVTAKLISAFVFATRIVQSLYFLNPKFQASSYLLWLYSPVCIGPVRKPERWFSHDTAHFVFFFLNYKEQGTYSYISICYMGEQIRFGRARLRLNKLKTSSRCHCLGLNRTVRCTGMQRFGFKITDEFGMTDLLKDEQFIFFGFYCQSIMSI